MKKFVLVIFSAALLVLDGCTQETGRMDNNRNLSDTKESVEYNPNAQIKEDVHESYMKEDVKTIVKLGENADESYGDVHYQCCVKDVSLTKMFKQAVSEWEMELHPYCDAVISNGKISNDYTIIYITAEVTNLADKKLSYCVTDINPMWLEDDGNLNCAVEAGYFDRHGSGKTYYYLTVEPGKTEEFQIGYVLKDERVKRPLYIEITSCSEAKGWILVPIEDKTLEE